MRTPCLYLIAGEASGDLLGAGLIRSLRERAPHIRIEGVGGPLMEAEGLASLFPYTDLSIMGFSEILPHLPKLLRRLRETRAHIEALQPDAVITIDSPGFAFRLAAKLMAGAKTKAIKRIHYVAPSVWAYKPERAARTAKLFNCLLALLPFEPPYFEKEGLKTVFVGHPVVWDVPHGDASAFRHLHGLHESEPILLLLPGSRMGEVKRHLDLFLAAASRLHSCRPVIIAGTQVQDYIRIHAPKNAIIADFNEKEDAFATASLALSKSGTVTLELAAHHVPTVVAHRVSPLSAWLLRRLIRIPYVSLVNIALKREILPELLQERATAASIGDALQRLTTPLAQAAQRSGCDEAILALRGPHSFSPSDAAANAILNCVHGQTG